MPTTIHQALVAAQAEVRSAHKSGDNKFDKYQYAKLEDFLDSAKPILAKHGLSLVMSTESAESLPDRTTKNGGVEHAVRVKIKGVLYHESGATIEAFGYGEGQDRADKSIYKAITGGKKYLVAGLLSIPTTDDPEADEQVGLSDAKGSKKINSAGEVVKKKPEWSAEQRAEAGAINNEILSLSAAYKDEVAALWKQHAYDPPQDYIDAAAALLAVKRDIHSNINPEGDTQ